MSAYKVKVDCMCPAFITNLCFNIVYPGVNFLFTLFFLILEGNNDQRFLPDCGHEAGKDGMIKGLLFRKERILYGVHSPVFT